MLKYIDTSPILWKKIFKCFIAYEIGSILVLIPKVIHVTGNVPYLLVLGTLFYNASGTVGNQIVEMMLNALMMALNMVWCLLIYYLCTVYNRNIEAYNLYFNGAGVIAAIAFFICVLITAYSRLKYPRLFIPSLVGFTMPFFGLTKGIYSTEFNPLNIIGNFYPILLGGAIALFVNLLIWPETAAKNSEASFGDALKSIQNVLEFVNDQVLTQDTESSFIGDVSITKKLHQTIQRLDSDIARMKAAKTDAKYEIVISHYKPTWYKDFGKTLEGLSINLYGFSLSVARESQIMQLKKIQTHFSKSNQLTISRIEYRLLSQLHQDIQPEIKKFTQIALKVTQLIQCRLQEKQAIPYREISICRSEIESLEKGMQCLQNAKLIMQQSYEKRGTEPTEDHYLIYTVLFSLTQIGKKLILLETQADQLIARRRGGRFPRVFFPHVNFKKWLTKSTGEPHNVSEQVLFDHQNLRQKEEEHMEHGDMTNTAASMESEWIPDEKPLQNSPGKHSWNKWLYAMTEFFKTDAMRYAIKFAITCEILAIMAWLPVPGANELYNNNHGQWALLSCMVVFNFTVGATALQCFFRILATIIGAVCGYICLLAASRRDNPYVLAVLVGVFQIPMWYSLLGNKYPRIGFISLLTLAVIVSTGYLDVYNEDLFAPVWKRTLTAIIAIVVVMLVNQILWPAWARKLLRKQLSDLLIATGIQYSKVASLVCQENTKSYRYLYTLNDCKYNSKMLRRQYQLTSQMLQLAATEPRLTKGPFPMEVYRDLLSHELNLLYWIDHLLKTQSFVSDNVRKKVMNPMNPYRKELAAAVHLYLFTLAGSLRTKSSLPATLPSAETARQVLQNHQKESWNMNFEDLRRLDSSHSETEEMAKQERGAENNIYWQTYAAGTIEVIFEQEEMAQLVTKLMGQHIFRAATKDWIA